MKQKVTWLWFNAMNFIRKVINYGLSRLKIKYIVDPKFPKKQIMNIEQAQEEIKRIIEAGKPAMVARFGGNEASCTAEAIGIRLGVKKEFTGKLLQSMHMNAGVFPYGHDMCMRFGQISEEAAKQVDLLAWWRSPMQDYLVKHVCRPDMKMTLLEELEPYYSNNPWTEALKGKKVLVIHPFKSTIEAQYQKRELLFEDPRILPEFELHVLQAVQTIAGEKDERFEDWEAALSYMHQEAMKIDFDVAIIGCGAYGMPLAAKIKESGKIAIHLGGATQLLFGIRGARWDHYLVSRFFNEHWTRPAESEKPKSAAKVEGACYW